jgi:glutathione S-transferase
MERYAMKLYGKGSSRSFRCLWAAEEAGLDVDYIDVAFGSDGDNGTNSEAYRLLNYQGKVPTLVDENQDLVLTESGAIVNYIASISAQKALIPLPEELKSRALYDQLAFFALTDLEQPLWTNGKHRFAIPKEHRVPDVLNTTIWEFDKSQKALVGLIGEHPKFAIGEHFSMADIFIAHSLSWAESFKFELFDGLKEYKDRMYAREACQRALAKIAA